MSKIHYNNKLRTQGKDNSKNLNLSPKDFSMMNDDKHYLAKLRADNIQVVENCLRKYGTKKSGIVVPIFSSNILSLFYQKKL